MKFEMNKEERNGNPFKLLTENSKIKLKEKSF